MSGGRFSAVLAACMTLAAGLLTPTVSIAEATSAAGTSVPRIATSAAGTDRLLPTRMVVYPRATAVHDRVQLVYMRTGWDLRQVVDPEIYPSRRLLASVVTKNPQGRVVWRSRSTTAYTPAFDWDARRQDGSPLSAGAYLARLTVKNVNTGNIHTINRKIRVSDKQLVQAAWTRTLAAASVPTYTPVYSGSCNGCGERCNPVPSSRFMGGLSFAPCDQSYYRTDRLFRLDVPFREAPVDSYRVTATGGPPTAEGTGTGAIGWPGLVPLGPGDDTRTSHWRTVHLHQPSFLPDARGPMAWAFTRTSPEAYDIATFTLEYRRYVPVP